MKEYEIVCVNRYGLSFAKNKSPSHYETSGLLFASYYRFACTRCGFTFAGPKWKRHNLKECDAIVAEEKRGAYARLGIPDLKKRHLSGDHHSCLSGCHHKEV
jgi:hypothetical protein